MERYGQRDGGGVGVTPELFLAIWGATIATILAVKEILAAIRNRTDIRVAAVMTYAASTEGVDTHGTLYRDMQTNPPAWKEANIEIIVKNQGEQPCQITDVLIEDEVNYVRVTPPQLPAILAPKSSIALLVQPEVVDMRLPTPADGSVPPQGPPVLSIGVLDGLGKFYRASDDQVTRVVTAARALPLRFVEDRQSEPGLIRWALQMKDIGKVQSKRQEFRPMPMDEGWPNT